MKKYILFFIILFTQNLISQNIEPLSPVQKELYGFETVQVKPEFPGGKEKFLEYIKANFKKANIDKNTKGQVLATFIVEMDGSITTIKIIKDDGIKTGKILKKVLEKSPKWLCGEHEGYHVRTKVDFTFEIN
ncbi:hypothetical protein D0809_00975 [Flavobacterium circumlabens]|uniref:TonB C-terminal domain-containing protein n=1 Tax=Flavobacterium circumlabens TaxID=2133765 RepID=A0A4Y7UHE2_9FLAO|nr:MULTISPECIES: hypothetical protein [Flavobacterium]QSB26684.1 hypothetical protein HAV12_020345 [Flavobacterium sp. CLA17]TCN60448.1 hypothetical protein EV142_10113 [Flavobacterium circumlabens]TEB45611.1 hypothetical protein D0809_00975 [Flavobacterium circumlabens]